MKRCVNCGSTQVNAGWRCGQCGHAPEQLGGFTAHAPAIQGDAVGYESQHYASLDAAENAHFWFTSRARLILWALQSYVASLESFLEIGCGTGYILNRIGERYPDARLVGTEILVDGLAYTREKLPTTELMQMDARHIPYADEFSALGAFDVIEHIEEDTDVLEQFRNALRPGGVLLLTVPQHQSLWSRFDEESGHVRRYEREELEEKLIAAGFEPLRLCSFVSLLLPAMRHQRRRQRHDPDPAAQDQVGDDLAIHPVVNRVFSGIMTFERALISRGVEFGKGGSLLAVARKPD